MAQWKILLEFRQNMALLVFGQSFVKTTKNPKNLTKRGSTYRLDKWLACEALSTIELRVIMPVTYWEINFLSKGHST